MEEQRIPALNFYPRTNLSAAASLSLIAERFQYVKSVKHEAFSLLTLGYKGQYFLHYLLHCEYSSQF